MKKVLIIVAAAIAATFSMTSCVETTESASVTALREAKAEQLRALAEAERTRAAADSILAAAKAAWYQAQAEYEQAQADDMAFKTEKARAKFEAQLEAILLEAQNRLLEAQQENNRLQNELLTQASEQLQTLYRTYFNEVKTLNELKLELNDANFTLVSAENGLISAEQTYNSLIAMQEREIARYQAQIEAWQKYTGLDKADLQAEADRLYQEQINAHSDYVLKYRQMNDARTAYTEALSAKYNIYNVGAETHEVVKAFSDIMDYVYYDAIDNTYYYPIVPSESNTDAFEDERLQYENGYTLNAYYYYVPESQISGGRLYLNNQIEIYEDYIGVPSSGTGASAVAATGIYARLEDAQTRLAAAVTAKDETLIEQITIEIQQIEEELEEYNGYLADYKADLENFEALVKVITGETYEAYVAEVKALGESEEAKAYFDAAVLYVEAYDLYSDINSDYSVALDYLNNYGILDVQEQIDQLNSNIGDCQTRINNYRSNITDSESALQEAKDRIADLTERIAIQEEIVALALQAIDDFIAANGTPEE